MRRPRRLYLLGRVRQARSKRPRKSEALKDANPSAHSYLGVAVVGEIQTVSDCVSRWRNPSVRQRR